MDGFGGGEEGRYMEGVSEKLLCVKKVAEIVDLSPRQVWRLSAARQFLQPVRIGHSARWRWSEIQAYLDELKGRGAS